jgi:hypothetical protein
MPELRRREYATRAELQSIADQTTDRAAYLRLAEALTAFLTRLRASAETLDIIERQQVNVQKLAAGYRASKVIGSSITNDANETIGKIDDLLVSSDGKDPYAVLSIGGFLGVGSHLVAVPLRQPEIYRQKVRVAGWHKRRSQNAA